jgi:hypothetical protein
MLIWPVRPQRVGNTAVMVREKQESSRTRYFLTSRDADVLVRWQLELSRMSIRAGRPTALRQTGRSRVRPVVALAPVTWAIAATRG